MVWNRDDLLFVHTADLHLAPRPGSITKIDPATGRMLRDIDRENALSLAVDDAIAQDERPVAFVIAGDIFDSYRGSIDALISVREQLLRLLDNGISVLSIAGNHDTPTNTMKTSMYEALADSMSNYRPIDGNDAKIAFAYDSIEHVNVGDITFTLLPHLCCLEGRFSEEDLIPDDALDHKVLVVHGVAAGDPSLKQMDESKEIPIAKWILDLDWDYVAFGHFHKPGWISKYSGKAAYSGSLENTVISGPDVCMERGPVYVDLRKPRGERFDMHPQDIRNIINLPSIDVTDDMSADDVDERIRESIEGNDESDSIVLLTVKNITKAQYKTLPRRNFQAYDDTALYVKVKFEFASAKSADDAHDDAISTDSSQNSSDSIALLPLAKEAEQSIDALVEKGEIPSNRKEDITKIIKSFIGD